MEIENIHARLAAGEAVPIAVRLGNAVTAVPRLLAMLCILAVFIPALFLGGIGGALFVPLSLAVGFSMIASYLLSSTFVPVMCAWLLHAHAGAVGEPSPGPLQQAYAVLARLTVAARWLTVPAYLALAAAAVSGVGRELGTEIFPPAESGQFRLRLRAPDGTDILTTEAYLKRTLELVAEEAGGKDKLSISVAFVGVVPATYPINAVYEWMAGPHEAVLRVALQPGTAPRMAEFQERLRRRLTAEMPRVTFGFEAGDLVSEVTSFGYPAPVAITVSGASLPDNRKHAEAIRAELAKIAALRDLQFVQSLAYPTVQVTIDREKAGLAGVSADRMARSLVAGTSSSRYLVANFWPDSKTGIGYSVQVEIPQDAARAGRPGFPLMNSLEQVRNLPVDGGPDRPRLLLRDVATIQPGTMPGEFDRYNMKRMITITANVHGADLGRVSQQVRAAVAAAGEPPRGVRVDLRGQLAPLEEMITGLTVGLGLAALVIGLLLVAYFQSVRLAATIIVAVPGVLAGVVLALWLTHTTLNVQSFMGAIMAVGVAVANAILLATFAEQARLDGADARAAAVAGAAGRLRAVLMTSAAMIAGMLPMALGTAATAALAKAVIGGLVAATATTLLALPAVFALLSGRAGRESASLDPTDRESSCYSPIAVVED